MFRRRCGVRRKVVSQLHKLPLVLFSCVGHLRGSMVPGIPGSVLSSSSPLSQYLHNFDSTPNTSSQCGPILEQGFQISFENSQRFDCSGLKPYEKSHTLLLPIVGFISSQLLQKCPAFAHIHADTMRIVWLLVSLTSPVYILNSCRYLAHSFVVLSMGL